MEAPLTDLYTLLSYQDESENQCRFLINTSMKQYVNVVLGYVMAKTVQTCPAMFEIDLAIQAIKSIHPELAEAKKLHPQIYNVVNQCPIFMDPSRTVFLDFELLTAGTSSSPVNSKVLARPYI